MNRTIAAPAVTIFALAASQQALAATGRTPGVADVSATGEGSYSIPISAPPGTHGMTPQMGFVYSHRNSSTLLGAGWSIAGLSAITRCQKNWAFDGEGRDVRDLSDRFCLDGNKLRLTSGTYGAQQVGVLNMPLSAIKSRMIDFANVTNSNRLIYSPGFNSNSYAFTFVESLGFSRPTPSVWAPGWRAGAPSPELSYTH
jgi:Salmonella virulence plasmid 65kDa B protein